MFGQKFGQMFGISSRRVVTPEGTRDALVLVEGGRIARLAEPGEAPPGTPVEDLGDAMLLPGLVDSHVHVNEPGRTEWEGFETATAAAAAGGVTAIVDMPLNCIPVTTSLEALDVKLEAIARHLRVDAAFWGGVVPGNAGELEGMVERGVVGFKVFLVHSGIDDFPETKPAELRRHMEVLARLGVPLLVHAELEEDGVPGEHRAAPAAIPDGRRYRTWLDSRPRSMEDRAIETMIALCRETGCRVHIVHLSSASALPRIRAAKDEGLPFSAETCPHYLCLTAEEVPDGETAFKCAPPIREASNREGLWEGLRDGTIDLVVSDHSPCTPELKRKGGGDFLEAWGGVASLQLGLLNVWTEARRRGFEVEDVVRWMSAATAALAGLEGRKGRIAPGFDADLVAFDPEATSTIEAAAILHRHKTTPYLGREVRGRVLRTWLRGEEVARSGQIMGSHRGELLLAPGGRA